MSDTALAGKAVPWKYQEQTYLLGHTDLDLELLFQGIHEAWALERIEATQSKMSLPAYEGRLARHDEMVAGNRFAFGAPLSLRFLTSPAGTFEYILLKMMKGSSEGGARMDREELRKIQRVNPTAWNALVEKVTRADFPNLVTPESKSSVPATHTPSTTES